MAVTLNVLPAGSLADSVAVIGPSDSPDRLTDGLTGAPLTLFTTTLWVPSLNVIVPLSSGSSPLTVNCACPALALPMFGKGERNRRTRRGPDRAAPWR